MRTMVPYRKISIIIISLLIIPIFTLSSHALNNSSGNSKSNILYVSKSGSTYYNIQDALDNASDGDTIIIGNGTYEEENLVIKNDDIILKGNSSFDTNLLFHGFFTIFIKTKSDNITITGLNITVVGNNNTVLKFSGNRSIVRDCQFHTYSEWSSVVKTGNEVNNITIDSCFFYTVGNYSSNINVSEKDEFIKVNNSDLNMVGMESSSCFLFDSSNILIENSIFNSTYLNWWGDTKEYRNITKSYMLCGIKMEKVKSIRMYNISFFLEGRDLPHGSIDSIGIYSKEYQSIDSPIYHSSNIKIEIFKGNVKRGYLFVLNNIMNIEISNGMKTKDILRESITIKDCSNIEYFNNNISNLIIYNVDEKCKVVNNRFLRLKVTSSHFYDQKDKNIDIVIKNNLILNNYGNFVSLSVIGSKINILNNTIRSKSNGMWIGGRDINLSGNYVDFESFSFGDYGIFITSYWKDNEGKRIKSNINVSNNFVRGKGEIMYRTGYAPAPIAAIGIQLSGVTGGIVYRNRINISGNGTMDTDNRNIGLWMHDTEDIVVSNNFIHTISNGSTGLLIGEGRMGSYQPKVNLKNKIVDNIIISEDNRSRCMEITNISINNTYRENILSLKNGTDMTFLHAANRVEGEFYFNNAERHNSIGNDVVLIRGYPFLPDYFETNYCPNITVYNLEVKRADIMERCKLEVWQKYEAISYDSMNWTMPDMDYSIYNDGRYYNTTGYNGTFEVGNEDVFGPFWVRDAYYQGNYPTIEYDTTIKAKCLMDTLWEEERTDNIGKSTREVFHVPDFYKPLVPSGLQAEALPNSQNVKVSWDPVLNHLTHYVLEADLGDGWEVLIKPGRNETEFLHEDLVQDLVIKYRIAGSNRGLNSDFTSPVQVTVGDITPPSPPDDIEVLFVNMSTISIKWKVPFDEDVINVKAEIRISGSDDIIETKDLQRNENFTEFNDLEQNTEYIIKVTFFDDADHLSFDSISARTSVLTGIIHIQVWFEEGSPEGGYGQFVNVELIGSNFTQPKGRTDPLGRIKLVNIKLPDTMIIKLTPSEDMIGIMGVRSGYIPMESDPIRIDPDNHELTIELKMEYYELDPGAPTGMIEGIVSYPLSGPRSGSVSHTNITLLSVNGSVYSRTRTDSLGYFVFNGVKLKRYFKVQADPLKEDGDRYHSTVSDLIYMNESVMRKQIGLILGYDQGDIEQKVVDIVEYGPVGMDIDHSHVIYIRFSHEIKTEQLEGMIKLDPQPSGPEIYLSEDKKTLFLRHDGLQPSTRYNVSVSIMLEFKDALGLNKTFKWSFWTEEQINDPHENDDEEKGINWWIPAIMITVILGTGIFLFLRKRSGKKTNEIME